MLKNYLQKIIFEIVSQSQSYANSKLFESRSTGISFDRFEFGSQPNNFPKTADLDKNNYWRRGLSTNFM